MPDNVVKNLCDGCINYLARSKVGALSAVNPNVDCVTKICSTVCLMSGCKKCICANYDSTLDNRCMNRVVVY